MILSLPRLKTLPPRSTLGSGFTLIDTYVISILGILMAAAIQLLTHIIKTKFSLNLKNIRTDVRTVQNFSISGADGKGFGVFT